MAESLHCSSETITTLLPAIPQYKIKSSKGKKKKKMYRYGQIPLPMGKISHLVFFFSTHTQKSYHLHFFFLMWKGESNNAGLVRPCLFNFHGVSSPFSHYQDNHKRWLGQDFIFSPRWKTYDSERFHDWPKGGRQGEVTLEASLLILPGVDFPPLWQGWFASRTSSLG